MFLSEDNIDILREKRVEVKSYSEGEIFSLAFGFIPQEGDVCTSPFRVDTSASCEFRYGRNNKLMFFDYGNSKHPYMDCYEAVKVYYKLQGYNETLDFINKSDLKEIPEDSLTRVRIAPKIPLEILILPKPFTLEDKAFWSSYNISKQQLIEDKVFPIYLFKLKNTRKGDFVIKPKSIGYAYTEFIKNRKKIYLPGEVKKFYTNCKDNDIGGYSFLPKRADKIVITKSYKDYRVLKNLGYVVIWFMNEGIFPEEWIIKHLYTISQYFIILFDNDRAGIEAAIILSNKLTRLNIKNKYIHLSELYLTEGITDPSDFLKAKSEDELIKWTNIHLKELLK